MTNINKTLLEKINKERIGFKKILEYYFKEKNYKNILNICCGPVTEEPVLFDFFKPSKLLSVDDFEDAEKWAKIYNSKSFIKWDISKLNEILYEDEKFDILLGRNIPLSPNGYGITPESYVKLAFGYKKKLEGFHYLPIEKNDEWLSIFKNLKNYLLKDASFFLTFWRNDEFYRAQEILKKLNYEIILAEENKYPCLSDGIGVAHNKKDYYVIKGKV